MGTDGHQASLRYWFVYGQRGSSSCWGMLGFQFGLQSFVLVSSDGQQVQDICDVHCEVLGGLKGDLAHVVAKILQVPCD